MAFDGVTIAAIVKELNDTCLGGRLYKIAQPENDELLLTIKTADSQRRLLLSADASLPLVYLTTQNKPSPMTAPGFCMLLRKHLQNGRITAVTQPGLERIIHIDVEHLDEMGDLRRKTLIVEIMGKHSNIIFCNEDGMILDSIKHVSGLVSSLREVLPGKPYFVAQTQDKLDPLTCDREQFLTAVAARPTSLHKAIFSSYTGISPILAQEVCHRSGLDGDSSTAAFSPQELEKAFRTFREMMDQVQSGNFAPAIAYTGRQPAEYAALPLTLYGGGSDSLRPFDSISVLLEQYYAEKNTLTRIRQKSADLRRIVQTALERNVKKYDLQLQQIKDTEKRDKYRVYGELLNTYGYNVPEGSKSMEALNYYTNETITIPLDPDMTPAENAKRYFDKYGKLKRTYEALSVLTEEVKAEIQHLESIATALDIALQEEDLAQIREELAASGYIHRRNGKREKITSKPFHYVSSDGFHIYVGKNNYQNDELTFKFATGGDWWFHAKGMPGSHVILKCEGIDTLPDRAFEEAARLAAYYSKGRNQEKVEIDYIQKKHVKKPNGSKPGFVVYYTNYSMMIDSDISGLEQI